MNMIQIGGDQIRTIEIQEVSLHVFNTCEDKTTESNQQKINLPKLLGVASAK